MDCDSHSEWLYHDAVGWQATVLLFESKYEELAEELETLIVMRRFCAFTDKAHTAELERLERRRRDGRWTDEDQQAGVDLHARIERNQRISADAERWRQDILRRHYPPRA